MFFQKSVYEQARELIRLTTRGLDPKKLVESMVKEIREGTAGPYHIGSVVKINKDWSGKAVSGESVSLGRGDVVSIVQANLGEQGQDKMVLLSDGKTRAVVPLSVLGESIKINEQPDPTKEGPDEFMDDNDVPPPSGVVPQMQVGDASTPEDIELPDEDGEQNPVASQGGDAQGDAEPKQDPSAQKVSGDQMTAAAVAVEAVNKKIKSMIVQAEVIGHAKLKNRLSEVYRNLKKCKSVGAYCEIYEMLFGPKVHSVTEMEKLFEEGDVSDDEDIEAMSPEDLKQTAKKYRKKFQDIVGGGSSSSTATQTGPEDQSVVMKEEDGEDDFGGDEVEDDVPNDDEIDAMSQNDLKKFLKRLRRKYQDAAGMTGGDVADIPQDDAGTHGEPARSQDIVDPMNADNPKNMDVQTGYMGDIPSQDTMGSDSQDDFDYSDEDDIDDEDDDSISQDQFSSMTPDERRSYLRKFRRKYVGKYAGVPSEKVIETIKSKLSEKRPK